MKSKAIIITVVVLFTIFTLTSYAQDDANSNKLSKKFYFGFDGSLNYETYAGQFHESSTLPLSKHGSIIPAGFSVGPKIYWRPVNFLDVFFGGTIQRTNQIIGKQGEELKGWTYQGGWTSSPLPQDVYYHVNSTLMQIGLRILHSFSWSESWIGGSLNFGSYIINLGSKNNNQAYSENVSDTGMGYSISAGLDFPIKSKDVLICLLGLFVEYGGISAENISIENYIWQGITHTITQQTFGLKPIKIGINFKVPLGK
ncbi:MAG TPA: hypothetical protein PLQ61_10185 [Bacteroidales bacterium]|nr:hypothetical protein [Bacteroidales bacterium]